MTTGERTPTVSDKTLRRLVIFGSIGLFVLLAAFGAIYYFGQHVDAGPSLTDRAVTNAEKAVKKSPTDVGLRLNLAQAYAADNRKDEAIAQYSEILKAIPNNATALSGRAGMYITQNKLTQAGKDYQTILSMSNSTEFRGANTTLQAAHYWMGYILNKQGKPADAAGQVKAALTMDKTDSDSWYLTGQIALEQGAPRSATAAFVRALTFVPNGWCEPYQGLVTAYGQLKDTPHTQYYTASLALCKNKIDEAAAGFKKITTGPIASSAMLELAAISETKGDSTAALSWYRKVLKLAPHDANAKAAVVRLEKSANVAAGTN
jgi:tetratricopeptide (TPR) repeat protein